MGGDRDDDARLLGGLDHDSRCARSARLRARPAPLARRARLRRVRRLLALFLFVEAAVSAARGSTRYQERYLCSLLPLVAPLFGLYARRGRPRRSAAALLAAGVLVLASCVPLSGFTVADNKQDSPFLLAVFKLEQLTSIGNGSLAIAIVAGLLSLGAILIVRTRRGVVVAARHPRGPGAATSCGASTFDHANAAAVRRTQISSDLRWVDHSGLKHVTLVQTAGADRGDALQQLFWNGSLDRATVLLGGLPMDAFGAGALNVTKDGRRARSSLRRTQRGRNPRACASPHRPRLLALRARGHPAAFAPRLRPLPGRLAHPRRRLPHLTQRRRPDARDADPASLLPAGTKRTPMRFRWKGRSRIVQVPAGGSRLVSFPFDAKGVWELYFSTTQTGTLADGRAIAVKSGEPLLRRA